MRYRAPSYWALAGVELIALGACGALAWRARREPPTRAPTEPAPP